MVPHPPRAAFDPLLHQGEAFLVEIGQGSKRLQRRGRVNVGIRREQIAGDVNPVTHIAGLDRGTHKSLFCWRDDARYLTVNSWGNILANQRGCARATTERGTECSTRPSGRKRENRIFGRYRGQNSGWHRGYAVASQSASCGGASGYLSLGRCNRFSSWARPRSGRPPWRWSWRGRWTARSCRPTRCRCIAGWTLARQNRLLPSRPGCPIT